MRCRLTGFLRVRAAQGSGGDGYGLEGVYRADTLGAGGNVRIIALLSPQHSRMKRQMLSDKTGDEKITVIVTRMPTQRQPVIFQCLQPFSFEFLFQKGVCPPLIYQNRRAPGTDGFLALRNDNLT